METNPIKIHVIQVFGEDKRKQIPVTLNVEGIGETTFFCDSDLEVEIIRQANKDKLKKEIEALLNNTSSEYTDDNRELKDIIKKAPLAIKEKDGTINFNFNVNNSDAVLILVFNKNGKLLLSISKTKDGQCETKKSRNCTSEEFQKFQSEIKFEGRALPNFANIENLSTEEENTYAQKFPKSFVADVARQREAQSGQQLR